MPKPVHQHIAERREQLVQRFLRELRARKTAPDDLSESMLRNSLPEFFDELSRALAGPERVSVPDVELPAAGEHGVARWQQGFDLRAVIREYGVLEHALFRDFEEHGVIPTFAELRALQNCLNASIAQAVTAYADEADFIRHTLGEKQIELGAHQRRVQLLTDHVPQIVWTADAEGNADWFNREWYDFTGLSVADSLPWGWLIVIHPEDRDRCRDRWTHSIRSGERYEVEYRFRRRDGVYRWFLGRGSPVEDSSGRIVWFGSCTEIDDQKQTEARLRAAREEGERLNRMKDEFLATVSHELRTPLQSILGWARLLKAGNLAEDRRDKALDTIERNARAQSQLIEDILDVSRIITGKARIHARDIDAAAVLNAAVDTTQLTARAKGVELTADIPADLGTMLGDADRLQQIVWNLLSNGVKFTPSGGHVTISARKSATVLRIVVSDDGQGIAPAFLPYVFDRFRQADAGTSRAHGGLGLGLAIVRHLVELHGGTVSAESPGENLGSTFVVEIPPLGQEKPPSPMARAAARLSDVAPPPPGALSGVRLLVVDDQADTREIVATILSEYGASVREASAAEAAIELLAAERFDALVSDIGMPGGDGYALLRKVRAMTEVDSVVGLPAIALTAYTRAEDRLLAFEAGYDLHVAKPVDPARLVAAVMRLVRASA